MISTTTSLSSYLNPSTYGKQPQVLCIGASLLLFLSACPAVGDGPQSSKMQDVPVLIEKLKDKDAYVRRTTLSTLGQVGSGAKVAIPAISELLKDDSHLVRVYAAVALKKIDPKTNKALPVLLEGLREKDETVCCFACIAFTDFGVEAVPALIETFTDEDANVRRWAISSNSRSCEKSVE